MASRAPFVQLHVHSHFSLLDGLSRINEMVAHAASVGMPALALTDHGALYGAIEFYQACKKARITPIIGVETYITSRGRSRKAGKEDDERFHLILLAKSTTGYKNLMKLVTYAHTEGFYYRPRIDFELLSQYHEGLIATSACLNGQISRAILHGGDPLPIIGQYKEIFGKDFYFELQHHPNLPEQHTLNTALLGLSKKCGVPVVATGDTHYFNSSDADAHDVLLCLQTKKEKKDTNRLCMLGEDFAFTNWQPILEAFRTTPGALENTLAIAEQCEIDIPLGINVLPQYELPQGKTAEQRMAELCKEGIAFRYGDAHSPEVQSRLDYELSIITKTGYASYFLIVQDFVNWAKKNGIVVGPGRGSAAGSIVSYLLRITNIDPIAYDLLFERFLNPERVSMPDIDLDFADTRRDEVLRYVEQKYGEGHVSQIITFGTMAARVSIRDVGRVLSAPYAHCDMLAKMIPVHMSLSESLSSVPELKSAYETDPLTKQIIDIAQKLEGVARHTSTHACGVVITPQPLIEYAPYQYAAVEDKTIVTQYSLHPIEDLGLLKFDFLGLSNLTILEEAKHIVSKTRNIDIDYDSLPLDDAHTYKLFREGRTTGVFQFESAGMKRYLKELKPTEIEDIIAMVALYRPGPMDLIQKYIDRKHGKEPVTYIHKKVEKVLKKTYGIIVYQEQVMDMATELAGMTKGQGYLLIKAVGKKIKSLLDEQKNSFIQSCLSNGISSRIAHETWELIEPFAKYGFNKAHSACYAFIAYQTAYMKAHFPAEFMAALLTSDQGSMDRVAIEIEECRAMGIAVLAPDINESYANFSVTSSENDTRFTTVRFGLGAIKNVGGHIVEVIIKERSGNGLFASLVDFLTRVQDKDLNKKSLESFIKSGVLDTFGDRNVMLYNIDKLLSFNKRVNEGYDSRQGSLFGFGKGALTPSLALDPAPSVDSQEQLSWEKELLGLYLSRHPLTEIDEIIKSFVTPCLKLRSMHEGAVVKVYGIVTSVKKILTKRNEQMLFAKIEDMTDTVEVVVFPSIAETTGALWREDALLALEGKLSFKDNECKILCARVRTIDEQLMAQLRKQSSHERLTPLETGTPVYEQ